MKMKALISTALLCGVLATNAWATSITKYEFSADTTSQQPESFHCVLTGADDNTVVRMKNHAVMITGFNKNGYLDLPRGTYNINNVYFNAYHDPNYDKNQKSYVDVASELGTVKCYSGQGSNRQVMPGEPGMPYGVSH